MKGRPLRDGDAGAGPQRQRHHLASMKGRPLRDGDQLPAVVHELIGRLASMKGRPLRDGDTGAGPATPAPRQWCLDEGPPAQGRRLARLLATCPALTHRLDEILTPRAPAR